VKLRLLLALCLGLGILAAVLARFDLAAVATSLSRVGIGGFFLIVAAGLLAEIVLASGIVPLLPQAMPFAAVVASRQLRDSAADTLPITQLGGIAFAARALVLAGTRGPLASAAVIADLTTETFAQGLYVLVGVIASLSLLAKSALLSPYVGAMLAGAIFLSLGSMGFAAAQLGGSRWAERLGGKLFPGAAAHTQAFREAIHLIYRRRGRLLLSMLLQLAGWMGSGLWLWVMLKVMGLSTGFWAAIALQALVEGLRSAMVFIPAAIGVQEAGYAVLAPLFGLPPETGLALAVLRRARDIAVAVPVLLAWQAIEARRAARMG
jgi:putative membrane protein